MLKKIVSSTAIALAGVIAAASCSSNKSDNTVSAAGSAGSAGSGFMLDSGMPDSSSGGSGGGSGGGGVDQCPAFIGLDGGMCGATTVQAQYTRPNIMLVIDKSGSMNDTPTGFTSNKWDSLKQALNTALGNVQNDINFGLVLYPYNSVTQIPLDCTTGCCAVASGSAAVNVPITAGMNSVPDVLSALSNTAPGGGTPTATALAAALAYYTTGNGAALTGEKYVLLATDGGPNCNSANTCDAAHCTPNLDGQCAGSTNCCDGDGSYCLDDQSVLTQIAKLKAAGVSTFVVGIPGSEAYKTYLDQFATAGGVPNPNAPPSYYAVDNPQSLVDTFTSITTHLVRNCDVQLMSIFKNLSLVNVAVDCTIVPYADGAGWTATNDDGGTGSTVTLKGDACNFIQTSGARRIDVVYGCQSIN